MTYYYNALSKALHVILSKICHPELAKDLIIHGHRSFASLWMTYLDSIYIIFLKSDYIKVAKQQEI